MKKYSLTGFLIVLAFSCFSQTDYCQFVNPFIGTGGHGHTYPGATLPFGMVQLSPDTRIDGSWDGCGGYHYSDSIIYGFSHTHLSGTGCSDYGDILLMPFTGKFEQAKKISSHYSHKKEFASPGYYSVQLDDGDIKAELTATLRTGLHRYTFPKTDQAQVLVDLAHRDEVLESELHIVDKTHIEGFRRSKAWAKDQVVYFAIEFSKPFVEHQFTVGSVSISSQQDVPDITGKNIRCAFRFTSDGTQPLLAKVGISSVNVEGARKNLHAELPGWDFEKTKSDARAAWNKELGKIEVKGGAREKQVVFYTALYHCMVVPNLFNDVDGQYRGRDFKIHKAEGYNQYTVFSLWDTFRAWHPLMAIIDRTRTLDYIKTFLSQYEEGGLLPVWELGANETECMIGYHSIPVIVDAAINGIKDFDMEKALQAMKKSAESKDRYGLGAYMDHGFLDVEDESESVSKTLEYAYDDWCIARFAQLMNKNEEADKYFLRSQYWKNLFDNSTGFMRPRKNGGWLTPFDPYQVNNNYTEANSWQYSFFVPQDIPGLIWLHGSSEVFDARLDSLFTTHSQTSGREQADITGMIGQYAHGNEPSHHMAYLYDYTGKQWKTQQRVHQILNEQYHADPDGLAGNEDCGQMSAWYVMSAMGFYCVTPGSGYYAFGTPGFPEIDIHLENGKDFIIKADDLNDENFYIQSSSLNDSSYNRNYIMHSKIENGGQLHFKMGPKPKTFGAVYLPPATMNSSAPFLIRNPVIDAPSRTFRLKQDVHITAEDAAVIYFTLDGSTPTTSSPKYTGPFTIEKDIVVKAIALKRGKESLVTTARYFKIKHPDWKITLLSKYSSQYTAGGDEGIIDGMHADAKWTKGGWQGYQGQDFSAIIDMGSEQKISKLGAGFLQDVGSWIMMPKRVEFEISKDGTNFSKVLTVENIVPDTDRTAQTKDFSGTISPETARYVKIHAVNYGLLPKWHLGAGGDAWIFIDEIEIGN